MSRVNAIGDGPGSLSAAILAKRQSEGLTLREAGEASGVAFSTLARIEAGADPSLKVDRQIRNWLNGEASLLPPPPMTLRDWFAGQALPAVIRICVNDTLARTGKTYEQYCAEQAHKMADAMLAERERRS